MSKRLALIKESNWDLLMLTYLVLYLEMYMESHLGLILEPIWDFYIDPLMVLINASLREYFLETQWDILMLKCLDLMKAPLERA